MKTLEVIFFKGLPGSGKTTEARKIIDKSKGQYKRINKDDLRAMFDNGHYSGVSEKFILKIRNFLLIHLLNSDISVIIDDTNLHPSHEKMIKNIIKDYHQDKIKLIIVDLTKIPLKTCIQRDCLREKPVGAKVIRKMYNQYIKN